MTWAKLDDRMHDDDRSLAAGVDAMGLWAMALSYMADRLTDGEITVERVRRIAGRRGEGLAAKLVEAGWWERTPTGWRLIPWQKYLISRSEVEDNRAHKAELGRRGGTAKAAKEKESSLAPRQTPASAEFLLPIPSRSRPDPIPEEQQKEDPPTPEPEKRPESFKLTPPDPSPTSPAPKAKKPTSAKSDATDDERKVFEGFLRGREYRHVKGGAAPVLDAKRLKIIRERLADGHTPETLAAAAFGIWVSQWHFDEGQSRFDLALRDGDHVERFARVTHEREQDLARFRPAPGQEEPDEDDEDLPPPDEDLPPGYVEPPREELIATLERHGLHVGAQALRENTGKQAAYG